MSQFIEKYRKGEKPNLEDWAEHLIESHSFSPGQTPCAFANFLTKEGVNSYELLARSLDNDIGKKLTVLDLGCGDGYLFPFLLARLSKESSLVGVDMSGSELAIAKSFVEQDSRILLFCSRASSLPISDKSVDLIVSHMAFMLMLPLEPVIKEISRVLKPGGRFSAVIANPNGRTGLYKEVAGRFSGALERRYPEMNDYNPMDPRVYTDDGLEELFHPKLGFVAISDSECFDISLRVSPQGVWRFIKDMYMVSLLRPAERDELQTEIEGLATEKLGNDGKVELRYPMRKFTVHH